MLKSVGVVIGMLGSLFALGMSWSNHYAEQKINTLEIANLKADKKELSEVVYTLNSNQARLIETVSAQVQQTKELKVNFKELLKSLSANQLVLAKILGKVERNDKIH
jgi:hypothetical protein